jgi:capsular exopolysaccharide synthesis family protein
MQNILEKAEREGAVHRMRILTEPLPPVAPSAAGDVAAAAPAFPVAGAAPVAPYDPTAPLPPRTVAGARLDPRLVAVSAPNSKAAEQYRALRTRVAHGDNTGPSSIVLITSPGDRDGKSLTVANLGLAMAQEYQRRICVVDANLRAPKQHRLFGIADGPGLSDILEGRALLDDGLVTLEEHRLTVLPAGPVPAHPAELLGTTLMRRMLDTLRTRFDCVLVDAPGAAPLADVGILAPIVDGIVVVVRAGITAKPAIHDTVAGLDGRVIGVVLNDTI